MTGAGAAVAAAWRAAVAVLDGDVVAADVEDLLDRYRQPHRRYHTLEHVAAVLRDVEVLGGELDPVRRAHVALAACAHDVVYDGNAGADERASADWARAALGAAGVAEPASRRVAELVLLTADHTAGADDAAAAVLLDADLAVLASEPAGYERYVAAVRAEYAHVPDEGWRTGRSAVLRSLLDRDPLYLGAGARARWQDAARANLRAELGQLSG